MVTWASYCPILISKPFSVDKSGGSCAHKILNVVPTHPYAPLLDNIRSVISHDLNPNFKHTLREGSPTADNLAKLGVGHVGSVLVLKLVIIVCLLMQQARCSTINLNTLFVYLRDSYNDRWTAYSHQILLYYIKDSQLFISMH